MWNRPDESLRWDVLEEHLDEACFLWTQWEGGLTSARHTLEDVAEGDEARLRAHLKALARGGNRVVERLLAPVFAEEDPERLRAASYVLLMEGERVDDVLQAFLEAPKELRWPFSRALSLSERPGLSKRLVPLLARDEPALLAATIEILDFRRGMPADALSRLCRHEVPWVQAAALRAACGASPLEDALIVREALASSHAPVRAAGLACGLIHNHREALDACSRWSGARDEAGSLSRWALALSGGQDHLKRLLGLLDVPELRREALWALGFSGQVAAAEACLPWLWDQKLAGVAAEAFCAITGLSLTKQFQAEREEVAPSGGNESSDEVPPEDPDAGLDWPEPAAIGRWWAESRRHFKNESRYGAGRNFSSDVLLDALATAPMRRRPVLALELAIRTQGRYRVETRDFSHRQVRDLEAARASCASIFWGGPFSARMSH